MGVPPLVDAKAWYGVGLDELMIRKLHPRPTSRLTPMKTTHRIDINRIVLA